VRITKTLVELGSMYKRVNDATIGFCLLCVYVFNVWVYNLVLELSLLSSVFFFSHFFNNFFVETKAVNVPLWFYIVSGAHKDFLDFLKEKDSFIDRSCRKLVCGGWRLVILFIFIFFFFFLLLLLYKKMFCFICLLVCLSKQQIEDLVEFVRSLPEYHRYEQRVKAAIINDTIGKMKILIID
jgi:hypothetical protein